jgi:hypothetical protein
VWREGKSLMDNLVNNSVFFKMPYRFDMQSRPLIGLLMYDNCTQRMNETTTLSLRVARRALQTWISPKHLSPLQAVACVHSCLLCEPSRCLHDPVTSDRLAACPEMLHSSLHPHLSTPLSTPYLWNISLSLKEGSSTAEQGLTILMSQTWSDHLAA